MQVRRADTSLLVSPVLVHDVECQKANSLWQFVDHSTKPRKTNVSIRQGKRNGFASEHEDYASDNQSTPPEVSDAQQSVQGRAVASHRISSSNPSTPNTCGKKTFGKKGDRHHRSGSPRLTPAPGEGDHTPIPQPLPPAPPAPVRYPSSKMTIQDMTKRAKLLLDYISRVQIDMAERQNRSITNSPAGSSSSHSHLGSTVDPEKVGGGLVDGRQERTPCSTMDTPLLSTPPQSVYEHPLTDSSDLSSFKIGIQADGAMGDHARYRPGSMETESAGDKEPITPPPQGLGQISEGGQHGGGGGAHGLDSRPSGIQSPTGSDIALSKARVSSLELMDKLSGDLIRFQEKYGAHS
jgi:hypothetical protein